MACCGFDPKTELADVVVTALEDPNTEVDVDPPNADTVEAGAVVEDDPNNDPDDDGAAEDDPNTDPEDDGAEADPPKAVLLGGAPPKTLEAPEPPNTELEVVVVVEGALETALADDGDSVLVTFSDPGAVVGPLPPKIPPELEDAPTPNAVLLGAAPPKTGLFSLTEEGTVEASVFFTVTEEADEPKAGIAAAVMAFPVDEAVAATVVVDFAPKLNTEDDDEDPDVFVNVVVLVSKSSLVAAGNFSPPEGAVDDKPKPSVGAAVVTAVVELWVAVVFATPNENPDFASPEPGSVAVLEADMCAVVVGFEVSTTGTGLAEPNENPVAGAVEDRLNPGAGAEVVTAFVVDEALNGVIDPDDDKERPKPRPGLLEASGFDFVVVCVGNENDAELVPPIPPEAEPKPNPDPAGLEMEDGAPKGVGAEPNPLFTCLSSPAGDIDS